MSQVLAFAPSKAPSSPRFTDSDADFVRTVQQLRQLQRTDPPLYHELTQLLRAALATPPT
jgi:hypothetical protein